MAKLDFIKKNKFIVIFLIIGLIIGFFGGMEYKSFQIRNFMTNEFNDITDTTESDEESIASEADTMIEEKPIVIKNKIGDEMILATYNLKVKNVEETQSLIPTYGKPKVAKQNTKFIVIEIDITNNTKQTFTFYPSETVIRDDQERIFETYGDSIGAVDNYINGRELSPGITETGYLIYQMPTDSKSYSLFTLKEGTKELYEVVLK